MSKLQNFIEFSGYLRVKFELGFDTLHYWTESEIMDLYEQVKHFDFSGVASEVTETIRQADNETDAQWKWGQLSADLQDTIFIVPDDYCSDRYNTESNRDIYIREYLIDTLNCKMKFLHNELVSYGKQHELKAGGAHTITPMCEIDYKRIATTITTAVADSNAILSAKIDEASGVVEAVKEIAADTNSKVTPAPNERRTGGKDFRNIIQYEDKDKLLGRLHALIDDKGGADVGAVIMNAKYFNHYLTRYSTRAKFENEFKLIGGWSAIHNYFNENSTTAIDKANKIVIFN